MSDVVDSFNIFVDSQSGLSGRGDDCVIQMGTAGLVLDDGQQFRLSVQSFNMYRDFYNVHGNNALFRVSSTGAAVSDNLRLGELTHQNTKTIGDNVSLFSNAMAVTVLASAIAVGSTATTCVVTSFTPPSTDLIDDDGTRQFSTTLTFNAVHTFTKLCIQSFVADGDHYLMFGGNKISNTSDTTTSSYTVTFPTTSTVLVKGLYACQRSTDAFVYVRCDLPNSGIETNSFSSATANHTSQITNSDILARIAIDYEFCYFGTNTGQEFILNLSNRNINTMRFSLRDSKDRLLARRSGNTSSDFPGCGTQQNTLGNMNFTMVLRLERVQKYIPKYLNVPAPMKQLPAREEGTLLMTLGAPSPL